MEFEIQDAEQGIKIVDATGETVAIFPSTDTPAYLAFVHGMSQMPDFALWDPRGVRYELHSNGEIGNESLKADLEEILARPRNATW